MKEFVKKPVTRPAKSKSQSELLTLMNVGSATVQDLHLLGIHKIEDLKNQSPDCLYQKVQQITGAKQDPCVWDVFAAIIHEANTGEKKPWWHWSKIRKAGAKPKNRRS